jgi:hypothetical protein
MKNHVADVTIKREPLPNIPEGLMQARQIQIHIKEQIAEEQLSKKDRPSWVEMTPVPVLVPVIRWIE